jgi:hypothetical protein
LKISKYIIVDIPSAAEGLPCLEGLARARNEEGGSEADPVRDGEWIRKECWLTAPKKMRVSVNERER